MLIKPKHLGRPLLFLALFLFFVVLYYYQAGHFVPSSGSVGLKETPPLAAGTLDEPLGSGNQKSAFGFPAEATEPGIVRFDPPADYQVASESQLSDSLDSAYRHPVDPLLSTDQEGGLEGGRIEGLNQGSKGEITNEEEDTGDEPWVGGDHEVELGENGEQGEEEVAQEGEEGEEQIEGQEEEQGEKDEDEDEEEGEEGEDEDEDEDRDEEPALPSTDHGYEGGPLPLLEYLSEGQASPTAVSLPTAVNTLPMVHATWHPIDDLIEGASKEFSNLLKQQTHGSADAAKAYRKRRGRHPPPGFSRWVDVMENNGGVVIESFFDQIYEDLEPFWAKSPFDLRQAPLEHDALFTLEISDHEATWRTDRPAEHVPWTERIRHMIRSVLIFFPDCRMMFNHGMSPNVFVPWEQLQHLRAAANMSKDAKPPGPRSRLHRNYESIEKLPEIDSEYDFTQGRPFPSFQDHLRQENTEDFWHYASQTCPPGSEARNSTYDENMAGPPRFPHGEPRGSYVGYVSNWKIATSPCDQPHLRNLHSGLIAPAEQAVTTQLVPVFSPLKIRGMSNDILVPGPEYLLTDAIYQDFMDGQPTWEEKAEKVMWRGSARVGEKQSDRWRHFQRQRLVSMLNGTQVSLTEMKLAKADGMLDVDTFDSVNPILPHNFPMHNVTTWPLTQSRAYSRRRRHRARQLSEEPQLLAPLSVPKPYSVAEEVHGADHGEDDEDQSDDLPFSSPWTTPPAPQFPSNKPAKVQIRPEFPASDGSKEHTTPLGAWLKGFVDVSFNDLGCESSDALDKQERLMCKIQSEFYREEPTILLQDLLNSRYLLDVDGIGYSSRFRILLSSTSLPIKSTIYAEWHDNRLVPWVHFVPMDNTFADLYGILDYFKYDKSRGKLAKMIAQQGSEWAQRVLRPEDMSMYMYRLLLEYARLLNDDREHLAYVEDLI